MNRRVKQVHMDRVWYPPTLISTTQALQCPVEGDIWELTGEDIAIIRKGVTVALIPKAACSVILLEPEPEVAKLPAPAPAVAPAKPKGGR